MDLEEPDAASAQSASTRKRVIPSEWRLLRNAGETNLKPGYDDLKKIVMFMKKGAHDCEIMEAFGLNAATMQAIRDDRYHPVYGVDYDTLTKIQNEFISHNQKIDGLILALYQLINVVLPDAVDRKSFMTKAKFRKPSLKRRLIRRPLLNDEIRSEKEVFVEDDEIL